MKMATCCTFTLTPYSSMILVRRIRRVLWAMFYLHLPSAWGSPSPKVSGFSLLSFDSLSHLPCNDSCEKQCHRPGPSQLANFLIVAKKCDHPLSTQTQTFVGSFGLGLISLYVHACHRNTAIEYPEKKALISGILQLVTCVPCSFNDLYGSVGS